MWPAGGVDGFLPHDTLHDDDLRVVYDASQQPEESPAEGGERGHRRNWRSFTSLHHSASKPSQTMTGGTELPGAHRQPCSVRSGVQGDWQHSPDGSGSASPTAAGAGCGPGNEPTFAQQVQSLLQGMDQQAQQAGQPEQAQRTTGVVARRRPGSGRRGPMHTSPAALLSVAAPVEASARAAGWLDVSREQVDSPGRVRRSGRRWRPHEQQPRQPAPTVAPPARQLQQRVAARREQQQQGHGVTWDGTDLGLAASPSATTPGVGQAVNNPLAALLGGSNAGATAAVTPSSAAQPSDPLGALLAGGSAARVSRPATARKPRGRNPLYPSAMAGGTQGSQDRATPLVGGVSGANSSRKQQPALMSPCDLTTTHAQRKQPSALHRLFGASGSHTPPPAAASQLGLVPSSSQQLHRGGGGAGIQAAATAGTPVGCPGGSQLLKAQRQRGQQLQAEAGDAVQEVGEDSGQEERHPPVQQQVLEQEGQQAAAASKAGTCLLAGGGPGGGLDEPAVRTVDAVTPGQIRPPGTAAATPHSMYGPPTSRLALARGAHGTGRTPGSASAALGLTPSRHATLASVEVAGRGGSGSADRGAMALQREFIRGLAPTTTPAAPGPQQRQRLAGGLHSRLQAILATEKATVQAGQRQAAAACGDGAAALPLLTVLRKELDCSLTKCLCSCDAAAAAEFGGKLEVVTFMQARTAREVDTHAGCLLRLRRPWRTLHLAHCQWPVVLCHSVEQG